MEVLCKLALCLLVLVGLTTAAVNSSLPLANATLVKNTNDTKTVRSGRADYAISCAALSHIEAGEKPTFVVWDVALSDKFNGGSESCHAYLPTAEQTNCNQMAQQLGIKMADMDNPLAGLIIKMVYNSHSGLYSCRVYVHNLLYASQLNLLVEDKPSAPLDLRLTESGPTTLVASWKPPARLGNLALQQYRLAGPGLRLNASHTAASLIIGELRPFTNYCLTVAAVNEAGTGPPTSQACATTSQGKPKLGAVAVKVISVSDTTAMLSLAIDKDRLAGRLLAVKLRCLLLWHLEAPAYRLPNTLDYEDDVPVGDFDLDRGFSIRKTINGLKPYSHYRLTYQVSNGAFDGPLSNLKFDTMEGLPPPPSLLPNQMSIFDVNLTATCRLQGRANGQLKGYKLFVYLQSSGDALFSRQYNSTPDAPANLTVIGLQPYTSYLLSAAAITGAGVGQKSVKTPVLTDPGGPTAPYNLTVRALDARRGLLLSWDHRPAYFRDGIDKQYPYYLLTYRVYWQFVDQERINSINSIDYWEFPGTLDKLTTCDCALLGQQSPSCLPRNDRICLLIPWPRILNQFLSNRWINLLSNAAQVVLRVWIQAVGKSNYDTENRRYFGDKTEPTKLTVPIGRLLRNLRFGDADIAVDNRIDSGESQTTLTGGDAWNLSPAVAVGLSVGAISTVLAVATVLSLGWRWLCARRRGYQRPFSQGLETFECLTADNDQGGHSGHSAGSSRLMLKRYSQTEHKAMSVAEFRDHVLASHANDNSAFQLEFEEVQRVTHKDWPAFHAKHPDNLSKNRYTDICPYDHSRVVLLSNSGKKMGDYINANYVDGYRRDKAYIACQGPVPSTFDDFWLMVWENRCTAIVMISNFVERGRRKCDQYWPSSGSEVYGAISVKLVRQLNKAAYCMREFSIRNLRAKKLAKERQLFHFHYSEWPDYGVPAYPLPVLNFVQRTAGYCGGDQSGPVVVHCSAGVGRTGTFICIESQIRQILCEKTVNVRGFLEHIRQQRMRLVQTEEQYIFIHDVLLEFLLCPEREISMERLPEYFNNLMEETEPCGCTGLETQYQLCVAHQPAEYELASALKPCNFAKNRADVYPIESRRVKLTCEPGVDGSDYINASHVHGYQSVNEFIVTQLPMKDTLFDFYRMIWEQNCVCVVSVHPSLYAEDGEHQANAEQLDGTDLPEMWPTSESEALTAGYLQVWFRSREDHPFGECREFLLASNKDDYSVLTSVWTLKRWPDTFGESVSLIKLVKAIADSRGMFTQSPIIVMDMYGGSYAGIICSLYVLYKQLMMEGTADVYSLFKMYHLQRPGMFNSKADLEFIYAVISFHAKYFSPSNSLSLRRGNAGPGATHHNHHGNESLTTQQSHDSHEPMPRAASPPETLPMRQLMPAPSAPQPPPAQSTTINNGVVVVETNEDNKDQPAVRVANGRRCLSASRSAHGSFSISGAQLVNLSGQCYSTHTG